MRALNIAISILLMQTLSACRSSSTPCADRLCNTYDNISLDQSEVTGVAANSYSSVMHPMSLLSDVLSLTPTLTLVGTLAPPTVNGSKVQASDITVSGSKVYVAYNTAGNTQAGAIDVIDISNPLMVTMVSEALYPTTDIHKVYVDGNRLFAAGATSDNGGGGNVQRIQLDANGRLTSSVHSVFLRSASNASVPAYAGTSVISSGSYVYALSGDNGGLSILNESNLSEVSFTQLDDARDISFDSSKSSLYAVTGKTVSTNAGIKHFDLTGGALGSGNYTLANAQVNDGGKSTIVTGSSMQIATAGYGGARLVCTASGTSLGLAANPTVSGLTAAEQVANAATYGGGYMFVANGEAGVSVYSINAPLIPSGCNLVSITFLGRFNLGTDASVNNLYYTNGHLVVATGEKGFKIIKVTTSILSGLLQAL